MIPLLYALHSGNLYGTERMALATAQALGPQFHVVIIAPDGPVHAEARRLGYATIVYRSPLQLLFAIRPYYAAHRKVLSINTRVLQSLVAAVWERVYFRKPANLQVVHGGADETLSYGRKKLLRYFGVKQVAVSRFVMDRLVANGSDPRTIRVIENFLTADRIGDARVRPAFTRPGIRRALIVSRLDPIKRIDLLMDAIDLNPALRAIEFRILGSGENEQQLRRRAESSYPNVHLLGFSSAAAEEMAAADMLLHLCPEEPFGLAILEAMAAHLPILVPDRGGASSIVVEGVSGRHFRSDDAHDLAVQLQYFTTAPAAELNLLAQGAADRLHAHYTAESGARQYRELIEECWA
jgi:glycosyltransferase involved in cell wall biosynthesis